jgi:tripartite-type tricarboxylate transporter receptor subunit TctC
MRMLSRRYLLLGALVVPLTAHAQNWPAGNIKIVVVYPPGGSTDMIARLIQPHMQQRNGKVTTKEILQVRFSQLEETEPGITSN